jgi:prolyl-tRNA synthetase
VRRDRADKEPTPLDGLPVRIPEVLEEIQASLKRSAEERQSAHTVEAASVEEAVEAARSGFARMTWDGAGDLEDRLNQEGVSVRCLLRPDGSVPVSTDEKDLVAIVARAY